MENSSKMHKYPFVNRAAEKKWEFLQFIEHLPEYTTREGISFRKRGTETRGFIDWWGKVTWEEME